MKTMKMKLLNSEEAGSVKGGAIIPPIDDCRLTELITCRVRFQTNCTFNFGICKYDFGICNHSFLNKPPFDYLYE